jgi:hypothetical protein
MLILKNYKKLGGVFHCCAVSSWKEQDLTTNFWIWTELRSIQSLYTTNKNVKEMLEVWEEKELEEDDDEDDKEECRRRNVAW